MIDPSYSIVFPIDKYIVKKTNYNILPSKLFL